MRVAEGNEIAVLISQIEEQDDPRESFALVQERMAQYRDAGDEVPAELERMRKAIETELIAESRGM